MIALPEILQEITRQLKSEETCYLVGGAVRDLVLERDIQDFDFCCDFDPRVLARRVADQPGSSFFVMDEERLTCRVILQKPDKPPLVLDFSKLNGSINDDIQLRDFTFNAMAIDLRDQVKIIDPLKGGKDLQERKLRLCNHNAFIDDPVRVIRAIRYATDLQLQIETKTRQQLSDAINHLIKVSLERKRDELFKILEIKKAFPAVLLLHRLGILNLLNLDIDAERLAHFRSLAMLLSKVVRSGNLPEPENFLFAILASAISSFKPILGKMLSAKNSSGHSRCQIDKYYLLIPKDKEHQPKALSLENVFSNEERDQIRLLNSYLDLALKMLESLEGINNRSAYQFFRMTRETGIDLVLLGLAKTAATLPVEMKQDNWINTVTNGAKLMDIWFNHPEICRPDPMLNGNEIMSELNIPPGPFVGRLMDSLNEEQAAGGVKNRQQALSWIKKEYEILKGL